ncbi:Flp pilus assembly protein CpaB [Vibrio nitrifigilis]|uniref:Flp pilus assembly protein CpaB n=1 Tax=Vibrio nitrifigilis TaxID=2789781 RepID=A0ABS0GKL6_9VIBR|nr:Flp pilus assembly protein CpaB [Vibrio nitrifigilis]MBF9002877.1 Flp pilus assembly protein CpaB [Vibrio nitrifigilis]
MKISSVLFVSGALVIALGGAFVARGMMTKPRPEVTHPVVKQQPAPVYTPVLMATRDIEPGDFIDGSEIRWHQVDEKYPTELYIMKDSVDLASNYGATVRRSVKKGQLMTYAMVVKPGQPGFIASVLTKGKRAVAIPTNAVASSSGLVQAGDHVDVILGITPPKDASSSASSRISAPQIASQTLVTNVRVLALNNRERSEVEVRDGQSKKKEKQLYPETVTLEVSPKQAEILAVAKEVGTLQLALRAVNDFDSHSSQTSLVNVSDAVTTMSDATSIYTTLRTEGTEPQVIQYMGDKTSQVTVTR